MGINKKKDGKYLGSMRISIEVYLLLLGVDIAIDGIDCKYPGQDDWGGKCLSLQFRLFY